ncbi:hypothetical protein K469DRAFT_752429 [Zopfia rhizophila CBS 207.26]|uniref:Uncharacterized protein n=1 Tax=Zopfia rhizophila CBS 207.26 TaxID=1314779 RepID=A0A6A6DUS5_9PEZI|nr:hypothetical protein K469DRAFT_752429 [Zopfia rhizophila CBS 207.26]
MLSSFWFSVACSTIVIHLHNELSFRQPQVCMRGGSPPAEHLEFVGRWKTLEQELEQEQGQNDSNNHRKARSRRTLSLLGLKLATGEVGSPMCTQIANSSSRRGFAGGYQHAVLCQQDHMSNPISALDYPNFLPGGSWRTCGDNDSDRQPYSSQLSLAFSRATNSSGMKKPRKGNVFVAKVDHPANRQLGMISLFRGQQFIFEKLDLQDEELWWHICLGTKPQEIKGPFEELNAELKVEQNLIATLVQDLPSAASNEDIFAALNLTARMPALDLQLRPTPRTDVYKEQKDVNAEQDSGEIVVALVRVTKMDPSREKIWEDATEVET